MVSAGMIHPSVLNVPRFAIASCRSVYAAHRTPASVRAAIFAPSAPVSAAYASSPEGTRSCASAVARSRAPPAATTFGAYAPYHSAKCDSSHLTAAGSGHSTVTVVVLSNGT